MLSAGFATAVVQSARPVAAVVTTKLRNSSLTQMALEKEL